MRNLLQNVCDYLWKYLYFLRYNASLDWIASGQKGYRLQQTQDCNISPVFLLVLPLPFLSFATLVFAHKNPFQVLSARLCDLLFNKEQGWGLLSLPLTFLCQKHLFPPPLPLCTLGFFLPVAADPSIFVLSRSTRPATLLMPTLLLIAHFTLGGWARSCSFAAPPTSPLPQACGAKIRQRSYIISYNCRGDRVP